VLAGLLLYLVGAVFLLAGEMLTLGFGDVDSVELPAVALAMDGLTLLGALGFLAGLLTAMIAWCLWSFRVARNLRILDVGGLRFTPGWVVGWWFVPIMNIWRPMQVHQELWSASDPDGEYPPAPPWMFAWWAAWLLTGFVSNMAGRLPYVGVLDLISSILGIIAAVLATQVVRDITERHEGLLARRRDGRGT
jgi:hypothetical protein